MNCVHCLLLLYLNGFTVIINVGNDENVFRYRRRQLDEFFNAFVCTGVMLWTAYWTAVKFPTILREITNKAGCTKNITFFKTK